MARVLDPPPRQDGESDTDDDYREDDDLVEASAPIIPKDEVQAAFDEIIAKARSEELNLGKKETRKEFLDKYGDVLTQKTQTNSQTLLHVIAGTVGHKSLTRCVIKKDRKLLEQKDESGKNALHLAILKRNFNFIEIALQEIPDLDKILRMTCEHMRNCIHIAIYHGLGNNDKGNGYTIKLIQRASEATLCATDQDGLTPLHIAVEYQRASEAQLSVVRALIAHGDGALDEFTTSPKGLSVYEYHQYTRSLVKKAAGPAATTARGPERSQEEPSTVATQVQKNNPMKSQPEGLSDHGNDKGVFQEPSRPKRGPGNVILPAVPSIINGRRESTALTANTIFDTPPSAFATTTEDGKSPVKGSHLAPDSAAFQPKPLERRATGFAQKNSRKDEDSARRLQEEERLREECADKIRQEFKLYYLRSTFRIDPDLNRRDQHKAARFLHGANIDSQ
jgi:ankyrin repeat protein